jgi:hypothetical protein
VNTQAKFDSLAQLMSDLESVRRQLAQVRKDLDRLEAVHGYSDSQERLRVNSLKRIRLSKTYTICVSQC